MNTEITGEFAKRRCSYNVYCGFVVRNHKMLCARVFRHPAFLIAVLLVVYAVVGTLDYAEAVR